MKYQQEKNNEEEIDIDSIDVGGRGKVEEKPGVFAKVVNTVDEMFKNPFSKSPEVKKEKEQSWASDMWNTISSPVVSLSFNNYNYGVQNQNQQVKNTKNDDFDIFGDFSAPTNQNQSKQVKPVPKPIAKPPTTSKPIV